MAYCLEKGDKMKANIPEKFILRHKDKTRYVYCRHILGVNEFILDFYNESEEFVFTKKVRQKFFSDNKNNIEVTQW